MSNVVEINNLNKKLLGHMVLKNINLNIEEGKVYGIIGKNGSGKSLLIKTISGLVVPDNGTIKVLNKNIIKGNLPENIGVLFDNVGLLKDYSALENLKILASINSKIKEDLIKELLDKIGLDSNDKRPIKKYSLGMKQKVGIVQAFMENPKLVILDEPMNGLDEDSVNLVRNMILDYKEKGNTIIITSHNKEDIDILCDCVYKMDFGVLSKSCS